MSPGPHFPPGLSPTPNVFGPVLTSLPAVTQGSGGDQSAVRTEKAGGQNVPVYSLEPAGESTQLSEHLDQHYRLQYVNEWETVAVPKAATDDTAMGKFGEELTA